jgi:uncharacterized damage-inducible protein DinB
VKAHVDQGCVVPDGAGSICGRLLPAARKDRAMTQKTATEKEMFIQSLQREAQTTLKLLKAYPAAKGDLKPAEKSRTARELAWVFVSEQAIADMALKGKVEMGKPGPSAPTNFGDIITAFEKSARETASKVANASEDDLNKIVQFPVGPGKMGDFRRMDVLWTTLQDQIHHRGQFSVYLRMAGGKVPSIYGPTADETWM